MLQTLDAVRTIILQGRRPYEMEAAVKMLRGEEPFAGETIKWMEAAKH
ncbi:MAG: hypothetical protein WC565_02800 [Parcubacteria group bacterium]